MSQVYGADNLRNLAVLPGSWQGKAATGQQLTNAAADTDTTATVVAGSQYIFTALNTGGFIFGILDPTTAANVQWVCPLHETIVIDIPVGTTTLHYACDTNDSIGYLRLLERP